MSTPSPANPQANILIIDDTPDNLRFLNLVLSKDYKVRLAPSAARGLSAVYSNLPDLILLDIMMPDMGGFEVAAHLKADPITRDIPIIFISALDDTPSKVQAFAVGGVDYVTKPLHEEEVLARVRTHLSLRALYGQLQTELADRKHQQAALTDALNFSQRVLEATPVGIAIYKHSGELVSANAAAQRITGLEIENSDWMNFRTSAIWQPFDLVKAADQALKGEKPFQIEGQASAFGKELWLSGSLVPFYNNGEQHLIFMFEDTLERQKARVALEQANEKLNTLVQNLEQSKQYADLLRQMGELLQACRDIEEAYKVFKQFAMRLFPEISGALYIIPEGQNSAQTAITWGSELGSDPVFPLNTCWGLRLGRPNLVTDTQNHLKCRHMDRSYTGAYLDIPMFSSGDALGLLHLEWPENLIIEAEIHNLAQILAENLSMSLSNIKLRAELEKQSIHDRLTGVYNLQSVEEALRRELARGDKKEYQIGVILADLDHFGQLNETHSKLAGDLVLSRMGELLKTVTRGGDIVGRTDNDEFLLILPDTNRAEVEQCAEAIRSAVEAQSFEFKGQDLGSVSMSIGCVIFPVSGANLAQLKEKAHKALALAKHNGRNRVVVLES